MRSRFAAFLNVAAFLALAVAAGASTAYQSAVASMSVLSGYNSTTMASVFNVQLVDYYSTVQTNGGGSFKWYATYSGTPNAGTIVAPSNHAGTCSFGCMVRQLNGTPATPQMIGAKCDGGATDDSAAVTAWLAVPVAVPHALLAGTCVTTGLAPALANLSVKCANGTGFLLKAGTSGGVLLNPGAAGITFDGCTLNANEANTTTSNGVIVSNRSGFTLKNSTVKNCDLYCIWTFNAPYLTLQNDALSNAVANGLLQITITDGVAGAADMRGVRVINVTGDESMLPQAAPGGGMGMISQTASLYKFIDPVVQTVTMKMVCNPTAPDVAGAAFVLNDFKGGTFDDITGICGSEIELGTGTDAIFSNVLGDGQNAYCLEFNSAQGITVNALTCRNGAGFVQTTGGGGDNSRLVLNGCQIKGAAASNAGLALNNSDGAVVSNCRVTATGSGPVVAVAATQGFVLNALQIDGATLSSTAIKVYNSDHGTVAGVVIKGATSRCISLEGDAGQTTPGDYISFVGGVWTGCSTPVFTSFAGGATMGHHVTSAGVAGIAPSGAENANYFDLLANVFQASGTGSPETNLVGGIGSTFARRDGGAATSLYVKESGTGNTGWAAK